MNADGSGLNQLTFETPGKTFSQGACFSPDGTKILFQHRPSTGGVDLFTMNPDGSDVTQVTRTSTNERDPEWAAAS
jgi:Tol biopolymer transport system component